MNAVPFDWKNWERRAQYELYSATENPFYGASFELDVTKLKAFAGSEGISFYLALCWCVTQAMNRTEAFRLGFQNGKPVRYDERIPSFTDLHEGSECFHIVTLPAGDDIRAYCRAAAEKSRAQKEFLCMGEEGDHLIYLSCLPWLPLTGFMSERDCIKDDSIPHVIWGQYREREGRLVLTMTVEVNHRFIDGIHLGKFYQQLCRCMEELT